MNIDLGPTFIDIAGGTPPSTMDGMSIKPLLNNTVKFPSTARGAALIEHVGEYTYSVDGCPQWTGQDMFVSVWRRVALRPMWNMGPGYSHAKS